MSRVMRKPAFCVCENKDADQLCSNRTADQRLCFRYIDSAIPLLSKSQFQDSSHLLWLHSPVYVGPGWKPRRQAFSRRGSNCLDAVELLVLNYQMMTMPLTYESHHRKTNNVVFCSQQRLRSASGCTPSLILTSP